MGRQEDDIILLRLQEDDPLAMRELFDAYYALVFQSLYRIVADVQSAEDLAQDLFLDIWKRRHEISVQTSLPAYLRKSSINRGLNHLRSKKVSFSEIDYTNEPHSPITDASHMEFHELSEWMSKSIDGLPTQCRIIFVMSRYESMSYKEIAVELGISPNTVENQISKALRILRESYERFKNK